MAYLLPIHQKDKERIKAHAAAKWTCLTCLHMTALSLHNMQLDMFNMRCCAHHCLKTLFGKRKAPDFMQVRWVDQTQYPEDTIESFVGQSSMGLLCPPADLRTENLGKQVVHTHTPRCAG